MSLTLSQVSVGTELPPWSLPVTTTLIVSTAIATRDFQDVHHDRGLAQAAGSKDVFMNILTSTGLVERYVTEAFGFTPQLGRIAIRLGAPAYPGDTLTFTAKVTEINDDVIVLQVTGAVEVGDHISGTVELKTSGEGH